MAKPQGKASSAAPERGGDLRVACDERLAADIEEAKRHTGIRSDAELVRYAVRQVALRGVA